MIQEVSICTMPLMSVGLALCKMCHRKRQIVARYSTSCLFRTVSDHMLHVMQAKTVLAMQRMIMEPQAQLCSIHQIVR